MSNVPEGAQLSDDGQYWWDGENWQAVEGAGAEGAQAEGTGEVTAEQLTPVGDSGVEPGDEGLLSEELKPYFEPDYDGIDDDSSYAEQGETMDDSQATGPANTEEGN